MGFRLKEPFTLRKRGQREAAIKKVKKRSFTLWQKMNQQNEKGMAIGNFFLTEYPANFLCLFPFIGKDKTTHNFFLLGVEKI